MNNLNNNSFNDPFASSQENDSEGFDINPFYSELGTGPTPPVPPTHTKYGLHWIQTLFVLMITTIVSFVFSPVLDIRYAVDPLLNPDLVLNNALFLAILSASIFLSAFFIELIMSTMTPRFSRIPQLIVAAIAVLLCAFIGGLSELFFVNGYIKPLIAPTPIPAVTATPMPTTTPTPTPARSTDDNIIVFALDKSYSMDGDRDIESVAALKTITGKLTDRSKIGLIVFCDKIIETVPLENNTSSHRASILNAASTRIQGTTAFTKVMDEALRIVRNAALPKGTTVKLLFITDGAGNNVDQYVQSCKELNIQVSCVRIGSGSTDDLIKIITETGGTFVRAESPLDILERTETIVMQDVLPTPVPTPSPAPTPSPTPPKIGNMLYVTPHSDLYLAFMFILFGLVLGITLTLMLSLEGQFRIQLILSPLMGLCAFLLIHYKMIPASNSWMAYVLFGIVLMRRNAAYFSYKPTPSRKPRQAQSMDSDPFSF